MGHLPKEDGMANGTVIRKNISNLTGTELADLRDAFGKIMTLSERDNRSWIYWSEIHGYNQFHCWHHSRSGPPSAGTHNYNLFLPWHRAYLIHFEHALRDQNR